LTLRNHFLAAPIAIIMAGPALAQTGVTTLLFGFDSARLTAEHEPLIDAAVADFRARGSSTISIVGHTDSAGSSDYNRALSQRRATAVAEALLRRGLTDADLVTAWRGQDDQAVATADGQREPANRRVVISVAEGAAAPAPAASAVPEEAPARFRLIVAPFGAYNFQPGDNSWFAGVNATASYDVTPNVVVSLEQAGFYNIGADDEGFGGRSLAGVDLQINQLGGLLPYVGANVGYTYIDGSGTGGLFAGPEVGVRYGGFSMKVAYDAYVDDSDRGIEDGVLSATLGYGLRF
jgi:hypothetical protein